MPKISPEEKRLRSDSPDGQDQIMQDALAELIQPPAHVKLRPRDIPFWESVVRARARSLWNDADLELAANLARCKSDIELQQALLTKEGYVVVNAKGTQIANPRATVMETLNRRAVALSRMLQVHAGSTLGDARDAAALLAAERAAREAAAAAKKDEETGVPMQDDLIPQAPAMH